MHHRLFVLTNKKDAKTSEEARQHVYNTLLNDSSFVSEGGGLFGSPVSDWFVIGGRWSGELSRVLMKKDFFAECEKVVKPKYDMGYTSEEASKKENKEIFQKIWEDLGGVGRNPYERDGYNHNGEEDDAKILSKRLWDKTIKPFLDNKDGEYKNDYHKIIRLNKHDDYEWVDPMVVDLEYDNIDEKSIATKWIVVVDYHS